jgi:hypothetical protein
VAPRSARKGSTSSWTSLVASSIWESTGHPRSRAFATLAARVEGYKLTFTKAAVYHNICTVHDGTMGTVVVG